MSILAFVFLTAATPPVSEATLARVQASYAKGDLCAAFEQTYVEKLRGREKVESGRLWAKRDGRVRWTYQKPAHKDFVYDGKKAWFYEPENNQVTEFDSFEDSPLWNALRFLWGQGRLTDTFAVSACTSGCPPVAPTSALVMLTPKTPLAAVDKVFLEIDPGAARVRRSVVYDTLGNRTEYAFTDVTIGCEVKAGKFVFERPPNVNVIRHAGDGVR